MPLSEVPRPGEPAGAAVQIALLDQNGSERRLADFAGRVVVLYFYPRDGTPGCTVEGKEFRDLDDQFEALDCAIVGVSVDSVESHRAFALAHALPFTLLSDPKGELASAFGVMGEGGVATRSTFIIGADLRLVRAFRDVSPRGHAQQMLTFVRSMVESHRMLGG